MWRSLRRGARIRSNWNGSERPPTARGHCILQKVAQLGAVKVIKQQINGNERTILKENATAEDLRREAARMKEKFGYDVQPDGKPGGYLATHRYYRGKYVLKLEPD